MEEIKCPYGLRSHMESEDCDKTNCDDCCQLINDDEIKPMTNADRIRAMSDDMLAKHLHDIGWDCHLCTEHTRLDNEPLLRSEKCDENCVKHCLEWLKQPAEKGD